MAGGIIFSGDHPKRINDYEVGHELGDVVDSLESVMVGKKWWAGDNDTDTTHPFAFYSNHSFTEVMEEDEDGGKRGSWMMLNDGDSNMLTLKWLKEAKDGTEEENGKSTF